MRDCWVGFASAEGISCSSTYIDNTSYEEPTPIDHIHGTEAISMFLDKFIPSLHLHSIFDIDLDALQQKGIKGVITNLDNTLVMQDDPNAPKHLVQWFQDVRDRGLKLVIVSNNRRTRVSEFSRPLGIPFVYEARKPFGQPFHRALRLLYTTSRTTCVVGDQLLTDIYGGNRFGMFTIWVDPISDFEGFGTKINRFFERLIYRYLKRRGRLSWDEHL